ncbi:MAG: hypothetical protein WCL22_06030, partial [bacterium]
MKPYLTKSFIPSQQLLAFSSPQNALRLAMLFQLERSQWWSAEEMRKAQLRQLNLILVHAQKSVPYYRDLWSKSGIVAPEVITEEFFAQLPISRRIDVQAAGDDFVTNNLPFEHGKIQFSTTSGSTGRPVRFGRTTVTHLSWLAFALREHLWHERDFSGKLCAIRWASTGVAIAPAGSP